MKSMALEKSVAWWKTTRGKVGALSRAPRNESLGVRYEGLLLLRARVGVLLE
jgi:hypothetical protein